MFELYSTIFLLFLAIASPPCPAGYECPQGGGNIPCPEGTYSPSGQTTCSQCPAGHYCPAVSGSSIRCPPGTFSTLTNQPSIDSCTICPVGTYCPNFGQTSTTPCIIRYHCLPGSYEKRQCPKGYYCPSGSQIHPCPAVIVSRVQLVQVALKPRVLRLSVPILPFTSLTQARVRAYDVQLDTNAQVQLQRQLVLVEPAVILELDSALRPVKDLLATHLPLPLIVETQQPRHSLHVHHSRLVLAQPPRLLQLAVLLLVTQMNTVIIIQIANQQIVSIISVPEDSQQALAAVPRSAKQGTTVNQLDHAILSEISMIVVLAEVQQTTAPMGLSAGKITPAVFQFKMVSPALFTNLVSMAFVSRIFVAPLRAVLLLLTVLLITLALAMPVRHLKQRMKLALPTLIATLFLV